MKRAGATCGRPVTDRTAPAAAWPYADIAPSLAFPASLVVGMGLGGVAGGRGDASRAVGGALVGALVGSFVGAFFLAATVGAS